MAGSADIDLGNLLPEEGAAIKGDASWRTGSYVSNAGDINGDGIDDFIVGAYFGSPDGRENAGAAYVVFGREGGLGGIDLLNLDAAQGFAIKGAGAGNRAGASVSGAGDVNGDGIDDIIIGAYLASPDGRDFAGSAYIIYGQAEGHSDIDLASLSTTQGITIKGAAGNDRTGYSVANAGDVNGDGIDDIIVGAYHAKRGGIEYAGAAYVIYGKAEGLGDIDLASLDQTQGLVISGLELGHRVGMSVSSAGDVNGDGIDDIIIGAEGANAEGRLRAGAAYVVYGKNGGIGDVDLSALDLSQGFTITGATETEYLGRRVKSAGDINGDGIDDIIISSGNIDGDEYYRKEGAYVIYGQQGGPGNIDLIEFNPGHGFRIRGVSHKDPASHHLSSAGDVDGDGIDDLIVGASSLDAEGRIGAGSAYVIYGRESGLEDVDVEQLTPADGFIIAGARAGDAAGVSVSGAGDVNGDGIDDVIVGATGAGAAYIVYGRKGTGEPPISGTDAADALRIVGEGNDAFEVHDGGPDGSGVPILDVSGRDPDSPVIIDGLAGSDKVDVRSFKGTVVFHGGSDDDLLVYQHGTSGSRTVFDGGDGHDALQIHAAPEGSALLLSDGALLDRKDPVNPLIVLSDIEAAQMIGGSGDDAFDISAFTGAGASGDGPSPALRAHIDGGLGHDVVTVAGDSTRYTLSLDSGRAILRDTVSGQVDVLTSIQQIQFDHELVDLFSVDHAQVAALYRGFFGRDADHDGFSYWAGRSASATGLSQMASEFLHAEEFSARRGTDAEELVRGLYQDLLDRADDPEGLAYWTAQLEETGRFDEVVVGFVNSAEFVAGAPELIDDRLWASAPESLSEESGVMHVGIRGSNARKLFTPSGAETGEAELTFVVTRTGDLDTPATVGFQLRGADGFNAVPSGSVTFAAGEESKTITVNGPASHASRLTVTLPQAPEDSYLVDIPSARPMITRDWEQMPDSADYLYDDHGKYPATDWTYSGNNENNEIHVLSDVNVYYNVFYGGAGDDNVILSAGGAIAGNIFYGGEGADTFTIGPRSLWIGNPSVANEFMDFSAKEGDRIALGVAGREDNFASADAAFASYTDALNAANSVISAETTYYFTVVGNDGFLFYDIYGTDGADHVLRLAGVTTLDFDSIIA